MNTLNKIVTPATDKIYDSVKYCLDNNIPCGTGNYRINKKYNIFVETGTDWNDDNTKRERIYYCVRLEEYDDNEDCIDPEVVFVETSSLDKEELKLAIETIIAISKINK